MYVFSGQSEKRILRARRQRAPCESAPKVDPTLRPRKPLITDLNWRLDGVTIGADDDPTVATIMPARSDICSHLRRGQPSELIHSGKPSSTIGFEKRFNKAFRIEDKDAFVAAMLADIPPPPPEAARIRAANMGTAS